MSIDPPNEENAAAVFVHYLNRLPKDSVDRENIDLGVLAQELCSVQPERAYNNSQIETICNTCCQEINGKITQKDLLYYIKREEPGVSEESMEKFRQERAELIGDQDG